MLCLCFLINLVVHVCISFRKSALWILKIIFTGNFKAHVHFHGTLWFAIKWLEPCSGLHPLLLPIHSNRSSLPESWEIFPFAPFPRLGGSLKISLLSSADWLLAHQSVQRSVRSTPGLCGPASWSGLEGLCHLSQGSQRGISFSPDDGPHLSWPLQHVTQCVPSLHKAVQVVNRVCYSQARLQPQPHPYGWLKPVSHGSAGCVALPCVWVTGCLHAHGVNASDSRVHHWLLIFTHLHHVFLDFIHWIWIRTSSDLYYKALSWSHGQPVIDSMVSPSMDNEPLYYMHNSILQYELLSFQPLLIESLKANVIWFVMELHNHVVCTMLTILFQLMELSAISWVDSIYRLYLQVVSSWLELT